MEMTSLITDRKINRVIFDIFISLYITVNEIKLETLQYSLLETAKANLIIAKYFYRYFKYLHYVTIIPENCGNYCSL